MALISSLNRYIMNTRVLEHFVSTPLRATGGLLRCCTSLTTAPFVLNRWTKSVSPFSPSNTTISRRSFARSTLKRKIILRQEAQRESRADESSEPSSFSSSINLSNSLPLSRESGDWIPPNRPLSGDSSPSRLYLDSHDNGDEWEKLIDDENLKGIIKKEADLSGRSVQYFDLDNMDLEKLDWKELEEQMKAWDSSTTNETVSMDQLFEDEEKMLRAHDLGVDGWEDVADDGDHVVDIDDPVLNEILSDDELFDENDEEAMKIQLQLIAERLKQLREEKERNSNTLETIPLSTREKSSMISRPSGSENKGRIPASSKQNAAPSSSEVDEFFQPQTQLSLPKSTAAPVKSHGPNWLKTRQAKLRDDSSVLTPANMMLPSEAEKRRSLDSSIPVIPHTLLSSREIISCLSSLGGEDIKVITPDEKTKAALGWDGLIVATGSSNAHIRVMAEAIVKNLRLRDLASKGVVGAMHGAEGGDNEGSSTYRQRKTGRGFNKEDGWMIVDCRNYVVHIQDEMTRTSIDLEALWSPGERGKEGRLLRQVSSLNDEQADEYVAKTPIPEEYTKSLMAFSAEIQGFMSNTALKQKKNSLVHRSRDKPKMNNRNKSRF